MIKSFATKWKDYILGEAIEQETNISFEMIGKDYISVYKILIIMIWVIIFMFPNYILGHLLLSIHKQNLVFVITFVAFLITIIFNYILIYNYGLLGAAYTFLFSSLIPFIGYLIAVNKKINVSNIVVLVLKGVFFSVVFIIAGFYFKNYIFLSLHIFIIFNMVTLCIYFSGIIDRSIIHGIRRYILK